MSERLKTVGLGLVCCAFGLAGVVLVALALVTGDFERRGRHYMRETTPVTYWVYVSLAGVGALASLGAGGVFLWSRPGRVRLSGAMAARVDRRLHPEPLTSHPPGEHGPIP